MIVSALAHTWVSPPDQPVCNGAMAGRWTSADGPLIQPSQQSTQRWETIKPHFDWTAGVMLGHRALIEFEFKDLFNYNINLIGSWFRLLDHLAGSLISCKV